jgi:hypothetical protein
VEPPAAVVDAAHSPTLRHPLTALHGAHGGLGGGAPAADRQRVPGSQPADVMPPAPTAGGDGPVAVGDRAGRHAGTVDGGGLAVLTCQFALTPPSPAGGFGSGLWVVAILVYDDRDPRRLWRGGSSVGDFHLNRHDADEPEGG